MRASTRAGDTAGDRLMHDGDAGTPDAVVTADRTAGARAPWLTAAVVATLVLGVLCRLYTRSPLWLDEALSVHIARLPLSDLHAALRQDGAPPVYYVLLHGWIRVFGQTAVAVRALSAVFGVAALPAAWYLGRRWRDRTTAWLVTLLLASSPFAVHFSSETRMYSLIVLEVLAGGIALVRAWERPTLGRLAPLPVIAALLVLTHYWSMFLLACLGAGLLWQARRSAVARRVLIAVVAGGVLVLPWVPTLLFQVSHTGTPWALSSSLVAVLDTIGVWAGGSTLAASLLSLALIALIVVALFGRQQAVGVILRRPADRSAARLAGLSLAPLALGLLVGLVLHSGYAPRYSSIALPAGLLLVAAGLRALAGRTRLAWTAAVLLLGLVSTVQVPFEDRKTQAGVVAAAIRAGAGDGDLVVYCPDQLGVAVQDLLPAGLDQVVYPTLAGPDRIDWVDYAQRNRAADPRRFAQQVLTRAAGRPVWLVSQSGYRTFGTDCEHVALDLRSAYRSVDEPVTASKHYAEPAGVLHFVGRR